MLKCFPCSARLSLFFALIVVCSGALQAQPQLVNPLIVDDVLHDIAFRNANEGYALGDQYLWHTSDAGMTWENLTLLVFRPPFTAMALFGEDGLIIGDEAGGIHILTDPDSEWSSLPGDGRPIIEIEALDRNNWGAITDSMVMSTHDGGATFTRFSPTEGQRISALDITNESLMHIAGQAFLYWRSTNGGITWSTDSASQFGFGEIYDIRFTSPDTGFVASWYPWNLYTTTDGGATWTSGPYEYPTSIAATRNGTAAYATTSYLRLSDNGGMTWSDSLLFPEGFTFPNDTKQKVVTAGPNSIFLLLSNFDSHRSMVARVDRLSSVHGNVYKPIGPLDLSMQK